MKRYFLTFLLSFLLAASAARAAGNGAIGSIAETQGSVTIQAGGASPAPAAVNTPVHLQDIVATGVNSRARIKFVDATELTLGEKTKVKVDDYLFDNTAGAHSHASYAILEGAFQYISGLLTRTPDHDVKIETSYGNIGIRGTKLWGGKIDGGYGIHVDQGKILVHTKGGDVTVNAGEGTTLRGGETPPTPPSAWGADKTRRALLTVLFDSKPKPKERHGERDPDGRDLPSDDMGGTDTFVPEVGGGSGGFNFNGAGER